MIKDFQHALRLGFYKNAFSLCEFLSKNPLPPVITTSEAMTMIKVLLSVKQKKWVDFLKNTLEVHNISHWYETGTATYVLNAMIALGITDSISLNNLLQSNRKNEIVFQHIKEAQKQSVILFYHNLGALEDDNLRFRILMLKEFSCEKNPFLEQVKSTLSNNVGYEAVTLELTLAWELFVSSLKSDIFSESQELEIFLQ